MNRQVYCFYNVKKPPEIGVSEGSWFRGTPALFVVRSRRQSAPNRFQNPR